MRKPLGLKVLFSMIFTLAISFDLSACGRGETRNSNPPENVRNVDAEKRAAKEFKKDMKLKITVGEKVLTATLEDNATARELISRLPLTLPMKDLYEREVVYRFDKPLPANEEKRSGYQVGDISYWSPWHSFVIFYKQNGEINNWQKIGRIDSGVETFETTGDAEVKFELMNE